MNAPTLSLSGDDPRQVKTNHTRHHVDAIVKEEILEDDICFKYEQMEQAVL